MTSFASDDVLIALKTALKVKEVDVKPAHSDYGSTPTILEKQVQTFNLTGIPSSSSSMKFSRFLESSMGINKNKIIDYLTDTENEKSRDDLTELITTIRLTILLTTTFTTNHH